jgi:hypothetical protein
MAAEDLGGVASRTLVMLGDDDEVTLGHATAMYRGIPDAELATTDPVPTMAPVRRVGD